MSNDLSIPEKYKGKQMWSYSKLSGFYNCKYAYFLQRIKKVKSEQNIWGLLGGLTHEVIEKLMFKEITKEEAIKIFVNGIEEGKILGIQFPTPQMEDNYVKSVIHYLDRFEIPDMKDFKIELKEFLELDENNVIIGFLDFTIKHNDGTVEIRDFKTSSKFTKADLKDKARQLLIYSEMLKKRYKKIKEVKVSFDMLKYCKVSFGGKRSKLCERHKVVALNQDKVKNILLETYDELDANEILISAVAKNEFPKECEGKYTLEPYILYYDYDEDKIKDTYTWIFETIKGINEIVDYPAIIDEDKKSEFWCNNLCGVKTHCQSYQDFIQNKDKEVVLTEEDDLF